MQIENMSATALSRELKKGTVSVAEAVAYYRRASPERLPANTAQNGRHPSLRQDRATRDMQQKRLRNRVFLKNKA